MTSASKTAARTAVGKISFTDLLVLSAETAGTIGACIALHMWMVS